MKPHFAPRRMVLGMALLSEVSLTLLAIGGYWIDGKMPSWELSNEAVLLGIAATLPMLACNLLIFGWLSRENSPWPIYNQFKRTVIIPVCGNLTVLDALILAVLSGSAEELFFRGAIPDLLGPRFGILGAALLSSMLFSWMHFIGMLRKYWQLALFYFLFGLYFAAIQLGSANLAVPMIMHALYNFMVLLYLKFREIPRLFPPSVSRTT